MNDKGLKVANLILRKDLPTEVTSNDLYTWVIWQFPRQTSGGLCGAVRPPLAGHTWYPAVIAYLDKKIQIYGHTGQQFDSPDAAASWLVGSTEFD